MTDFNTPVSAVSDRLAARLRTAWPMVVGHLAALAILHGAPVLDLVEKFLGSRPDGATVTLVVGVALSYVTYELGRRLEKVEGEGRVARTARSAGRWLLSVGLTTGQPTYSK